MKNKLLVLLIAFLFLGTSATFGQFTFKVSPGLSFNGASFGYKIAEKIVPFIGVQYASVKLTSDSHRMYHDGVSAVNDDFMMEFKGSLFLPNVGVKYFAIEKNNLKAFAQINFAIPMIKAEMEADGDPVDEVTDQVEAVSAWAGEFGVGVEYFFDENFSIGGEFGLRNISGKYDYSFTDDYYDNILMDYVDYTATDLIEVNVPMTYARISLNFYF